MAEFSLAPQRRRRQRWRRGRNTRIYSQFERGFTLFLVELDVNLSQPSIFFMLTRFGRRNNTSELLNRIQYRRHSIKKFSSIFSISWMAFSLKLEHWFRVGSKLLLANVKHNLSYLWQIGWGRRARAPLRNISAPLEEIFKTEWNFAPIFTRKNSEEVYV